MGLFINPKPYFHTFAKNRGPREYAEFIAKWKRDDGVKALTDEYKRITGQTYKPIPKGEVLDIFNDLDTADFVQEAFGAGNIAANAVTQILAKIFLSSYCFSILTPWV